MDLHFKIVFLNMLFRLYRGSAGRFGTMCGSTLKMLPNKVPLANEKIHHVEGVFSFWNKVIFSLAT